MTRDPRDIVCLALDATYLGYARNILDSLQDVGLRHVKCGLSLIHAPDGGTGRIAAALHRRGLLAGSILDAKLCDTPNTISGAVQGIVRTSFPLFTAHLSMGAPSLSKMRETLADVVKAEHAVEARAIGVTLLTSLDEDDLPTLGFAERTSPLEVVLFLIHLGIRHGVTRIVCSPLELMAFREQGVFEDVDFYVPGIRPKGAPFKGQKRTKTPAEAIQAGAHMLIIGNPILNPSEGTSADAFKRICDKVAAAL